MDGQGNLERTWKVREKSGNLKINGYGRQTSEILFSLFKKGKDVLSRVFNKTFCKRPEVSLRRSIFYHLYTFKCPK